MLVVVFVVVFAAIGLAVVVMVTRTGLSRAITRVETHLADESIGRRSKANFYGLASRGGRQVRGLGILALTPTEVVFVQMIPDREIRIPRSAITDVATVEGFLGKTEGRPLLKLTWQTDGGTEQGAWDVPDLADWRAELR